MRITFALPSLAGTSGGLRVAAQYAAYLEAQGHKITLVTRKRDRLFGRRQRLLHLIGLRKPAPARKPDGRGYFTNLAAEVIPLDENKPVKAGALPDADAIISTWWTTAEWAGRLPARKGRHIHFIQDYENFVRNFDRRVRAVYDQPNHKIVVAGWLQRILRAKHGQDSVLVMNGVDIHHFDGPARNMNAAPCVGMLWAIHERKNVQLGLDAIIRLRALRPDLRAIIFGAHPRPDTLPDWITYERRPPQKRIPEIYASCDLWLFSTRSEGFGLPLLEAMACRTPVLATRAGAAPDLIIDGVNGQLLPVTVTADAFASAADALLAQDAASWRLMSDAAWQTAQQHGLDHAARAFEAAVTQIVQASPSLTPRG